MTVLGIDLGTTFSCIAVFDDIDGLTKIDMNGEKTMPSIVAFGEDEMYIGSPAWSRISEDAENVVREVKRMIGRTLDQEIIEKDCSRWPFQVICDDFGNPMVRVNFRGQQCDFFPQQISGFVLQELKKFAEQQTGDQINDVVITVPAYFNDAQRNATKQAGQLAGLNVLRVVTEPVAAALAYRHNLTNLSTERTIIVFDLGGGTFDISLVKLTENSVTVIATAGDNHLGGVDFDQVLFNHFMTEAVRQFGIGVQNDVSAKQRLYLECEVVKRRLSSVPSTKLVIYGFCNGKDFTTPIFKAVFEKLCEPLFNRCLELVDELLSKANFSVEQVDDVLLVGGSTRIPKIRQLLSDKFGVKKINCRVEVDEVVAQGAAIQAFLCIEGNEPVISDLPIVESEDDTAESLSYPSIFTCTDDVETPLKTPKAVIFDVTSHSLGTDFVDSSSYHSFLIIDSSHSMSDRSAEPSLPWIVNRNILGAVIENVYTFAQKRASSVNDKITVIDFSDSARIVCEAVPVHDLDELQLSLISLVPSGGTNFLHALTLAFDSWRRLQDPDQLPLFVMLSDGEDHASESEVVALVKKMVRDFPNAIIYTIGFGIDSCFDHLKNISLLGNGKYFQSLDTVSLESAFSRIAKASTRLADKSEKTAVLIPKHTPIPVRKTLHCTNAFDSQELINVTVLEGEAELAVENTLLSEFSVQISPKPAGKAEIEVEFEIDSDGILQVSAREVGTQGRREIVSRRPGFLNPLQLNNAKREMAIVAAVKELSSLKSRMKEALDDPYLTLSPQERFEFEQYVCELNEVLKGINFNTSDVELLSEIVDTYRARCEYVQ
ncbi:hypothetical protein RCL1_004938 [Eukaryota sp. TZLM3-RCL]